MYNYVKAFHLIFIVTWFAGLFYMVRLFIYNTEANGKPEPEKRILQTQFAVMIKRLWLAITWPSAIITLIFGPWLLYLYGSIDTWMWIKLSFVIGLYLYHFSLQLIYQEQRKGIFRFTSHQLRIWNEVPSLFLVAIILLVTVKNNMSFVWGLLGLFLLAMILMGAIKLYKMIREKK
jgi:putative membrane protein